ncbi:CocE/NonD family hydrolase [Cetobacterium sp.]|uniref:CocE/NonD family hydrolase n=1 Tax=Cetobacterium sp. TaxID=2071632 RepID=UPI003EE6E1DB
MNCTGSKEEKEWTIAVIEWLNGKRKAYTNLTDNIEIKAEWCSGKVAMCGKSYLGTLGIAAATTGVKGLKTIIPEAAISNWYNYYRVNGVVGTPLEWQEDDVDLLTKYCRSRECDDNNIKLKKIYEETIISQMLRGEARENGNYNSFWDVKTTHCKLLWDKLKKYNIPSKIILHQGDHIYIQNLKGFNFNDIMNRW